MPKLETIELPPADRCDCGCRTAGTARMTSFAGRCGKLLRWLVPGAVLVMMPKCPACFAMYFAMATGIGLTLSTAASLRIMIMLVCIAIPVAAAFGPTLRFVRSRRLQRRSAQHQLIAR